MPAGIIIPEIVAAVQAQAAELLHISDIMRHGPQLELGRKMVDLLIDSAPGTDWSVLCSQQRQRIH